MNAKFCRSSPRIQKVNKLIVNLQEILSNQLKSFKKTKMKTRSKSKREIDQMEANEGPRRCEWYEIPPILENSKLENSENL